MIGLMSNVAGPNTSTQINHHHLVDWMFNLSWLTICAGAGLFIHAPYLFARGADRLPSIDKSMEGVLAAGVFLLASGAIASVALKLSYVLSERALKRTLMLFLLASTALAVLPIPKDPAAFLGNPRAWITWPICAMTTGLFLWLYFDALGKGKPSTREELRMIFPAYVGIIVVALLTAVSYSLWVLPRIPRYFGGVDPVVVVFTDLKDFKGVPKAVGSESEPLYLTYDDGTDVWLEMPSVSRDQYLLKHFSKKVIGDYEQRLERPDLISKRKKRWAMTIKR